ncbi:MAG: 2'-5' RNA ligase family protein [Anaerolineaceae bacterium]|nr:2'-5' RNA ligase family protein [Anaerolineaceae bacterium]
MVFALIHYPAFDSSNIQAFIRKYDPQVDLIAPHITLMFPVSVAIGEDILIHHIKSVLTRWHPFPIHLEGIFRSDDDNIYLLVQEGKEKLTHMHNEIYTGLLAPHHRTDIPYIPHVSLGLLSSDSEDQERILQEAKQLGIDQSGSLDKLQLIIVNDNRSRIVWTKEFTLAK